MCKDKITYNVILSFFIIKNKEAKICEEGKDIEIRSVYDIEKYIESDYKVLINNLKDNLISIFIIGSMVDKNKLLTQYNDYDIRVLIKNIDKKTYNAIKEFNVNIKSKLSKIGINTEYSFLVGPVRYITKSKVNLLLHCLPMTEESLDELPLTHKYSYSQNYRIIYGADKIKKYDKIRYSEKDIIFCPEGIDYCLNMINNNTLYYLEWKELNGEMELVKNESIMDDYTLFEVLRYSISKSLDNSIRMMRWSKNINANNIIEKIILIDNTINKRTIDNINSLLYGTFEEFINRKEEFVNLTKELLYRIRGCLEKSEEIL